jgi:hypothetical protein
MRCVRDYLTVFHFFYSSLFQLVLERALAKLLRVSAGGLLRSCTGCVAGADWLAVAGVGAWLCGGMKLGSLRFFFFFFFLFFAVRFSVVPSLSPSFGAAGVLLATGLKIMFIFF